MAGLGVQVLFGFLLSLPFTTRFTRLTAGSGISTWRAVVLAAVATILLIAPVAYHRLVFRQGMKERLVRFANVWRYSALPPSARRCSPRSCL